MITSIKSSFLEYKMTILRNKKTSNSLFRQTMNEASYLIAAEVLKHLQYKKVTVQTPLTKTSGKKLAQQVILVPILRAGLGLLEGFVKFLLTPIIAIVNGFFGSLLADIIKFYILRSRRGFQNGRNSSIFGHLFITTFRPASSANFAAS